MNNTISIMAQILKLFPDFSPFTSPIQYLTTKSYKLINFILQSIFFSTSVINIISVILITFGLTQTTTLLNSKYSYIINIVLGVTFMWLHLFEFSDQHHRIHEVFKNAAGFYVAFCCIEGCAYIKQKIDPLHTLNNTQHAQRNSRILSQLFLIATTIFTTAFFIILWYNIKISNQIPQLYNNYKLLAILLISVFVIYVITVLRNVSLFMPAIVTCLCIYLPIAIKIITYTYQWQRIQQLHLPISIVPILLISSEGRYKHINQQSTTLRQVHQNMDREFVEEKLKGNRIFIDNMYWAALGYLLYSLLHGSTINVEYMVIVGYVVVIGKGAVLG